MTALPHPPLDERERQNAEYLESLNPVRYIYKTFDARSVGLVFTLPIAAIVLFGSILFISDPFDDGTKLSIGKIEDPNAILSAFVDEGGKVPGIIVGNLDSNITTKRTPIHIGFNKTVTKGSGWFLVRYLLTGGLNNGTI